MSASKEPMEAADWATCLAPGRPRNAPGPDLLHCCWLSSGNMAQQPQASKDPTTWTGCERSGAGGWLHASNPLLSATCYAPTHGPFRIMRQGFVAFSTATRRVDTTIRVQSLGTGLLINGDVLAASTTSVPPRISQTCTFARPCFHTGASQLPRHARIRIKGAEIESRSWQE